jgi:diguanylate cyclase (GGDEF)-like protein
MSFEPRAHDPKTPLTGQSGRESVFDRRLLEVRNTGGFVKPQRKALDYLKKQSAEFETPSLDSRLHAKEIETEEYTETERVAFLDESSGLLNARTILSKTEAEVRRSTRYKRSFCMVAIELDGIFNSESLTPLAVEMIFLNLCNVLNKNAREVDRLGRFDRTTILMLLPETDMHEAIVETERLREAIAGTRFKQMGYNQTLTVSIGVASYPEHGKTATELLGTTLEAVQQAVAAGGNTVCAATTASDQTGPKAILQTPIEDFSPAPEKKDESPPVDMSPDSNINVVFPTVDVSPIVS